jgi:rubrerythrin
MGKSLAGTKTLECLKHAFAGESQANRRYLYFARKADIEGYPDIANIFRETAEGETGHASGHIEFLEKYGGGDPATGKPIGTIAKLGGSNSWRDLRIHRDVSGLCKDRKGRGL